MNYARGLFSKHSYISNIIRLSLLKTKELLTVRVEKDIKNNKRIS